MHFMKKSRKTFWFEVYAHLKESAITAVKGMRRFKQGI